jgi:hypothetical protein
VSDSIEPHGSAGSGFHSYKGYAQFGFDFLDLLQLIGAERGGFKVMALKSQQSCSQLFFQIADGLKRGFVYLGGDGTQHNLTSLLLSGGLRIRRCLNNNNSNRQFKSFVKKGGSM